MRTVVSVGILFLPLISVAAQSQNLPRTPDGHPDLQGIWANDTVTTLERPKRFAEKEVLSEQEAIEYEKDVVGRWRDKFGELEVTTTGELSDVRLRITRTCRSCRRAITCSSSTRSSMTCGSCA